MSAKDREIYEFEGFRLDMAEHFLLCSGSEERVPLSEKAFQTLCVLVRNAGHLVNKSELLNQVWADSFVEENNLNKCIHTLRRALGETPEQQFIETVKKHGFRFVAEVSRVEEHGKNAVSPNIATPPTETNGNQALGQISLATTLAESTKLKSEPNNVSRSLSKYRRLLGAMAAVLIGAIALGYYFYAAKSATVGDKKSIAVLPIKPINTANRDEIYEFGIAESLITKLSAMKGFVVRPLSATRKYTDIEQDALAAGKEQQVDYVLASNYQIADGKIRVTSQLFNIASGQLEETYPITKDAGNIFAMQDAIAGEVGNILLKRFGTTSSSSMAKRGTTNEEAYRLYLQGRNLTDTRNVGATRKAVEYFEQSIRLDPNFARGYSGMAHALILSGNLGGDLPRVEYEKANQAVTKALELDHNLAEGYTVLGELKYVCEWDFAGAEKDLLRAIELEPNSDLAHDQYAFYLAICGRFDEAIAESKIALEIAPNSLKYQHINGLILFLARRYDEAIIQFKRIIEVDENFATAYGWLFLAYEMKGDDVQAYEWFMKSQKRRNSADIGVYQKAYETSGWQGVRLKNLELEKLNEQKPSANYYRLARQCVFLGDKEQAFDYLNKAVEKHHGQLIMLNVEPSFDSLRDDPRFDELLRRVGLK